MALVQMTRRTVAHEFAAEAGEVVFVTDEVADRLVAEGNGRHYADVLKDQRTEVDAQRNPVQPAPAPAPAEAKK